MKQNCPKALFTLQVKHDTGFLPKVKLCVYNFWSSGVGRIWVCLFYFHILLPFLFFPLLFLFFPHFLFCWVFTINPHYKDSLKSFHENPMKRIFWRTVVAILIRGTRYSLEVLGQRDMYLVFNIIFSPAYLESCSLWYDLKDIFPVQELGIKFIYDC